MTDQEALYAALYIIVTGIGASIVLFALYLLDKLPGGKR